MICGANVGLTSILEPQTANWFHSMFCAGVVIRVNSDVYLRWVGACGHNLLKLQSTELFYCATCAQTVSTCEQKLALELCVNVSDVFAPIRVKVSFRFSYCLDHSRVSIIRIHSNQTPSIATDCSWFCVVFKSAPLTSDILPFFKCIFKHTLTNENCAKT